MSQETRCYRCGGKGYVEVHQPGHTHYETDAGEGCPSYHFERVPCTCVTISQLQAEVEQLRQEREADADKVKAFNLLLTAVNPVVRTLAERYLEGVKDMAHFTEFLRNHPFLGDPHGK